MKKVKKKKEVKKVKKKEERRKKKERRRKKEEKRKKKMKKKQTKALNKKKNFLLAIDQGTTGTTVVLIDEKGQICHKAYQEFKQHFPKPGWVEHDLDDIWKSFTKSLKNLLDKSQISPSQILSIGITNQRETVGAWDRKTHKAFKKAIVWQCRRTSHFCQTLKKRGLEKTIKSKTGLVLDPYFSASKIRWFLKNGLSYKTHKNLIFGNIDTYLLFRLTRGRSFKTDVSNASRTQLMNLKNTKWDEELLKLFGVKKTSLAEITDNSGMLGTTYKVAFLPDGIPISGMIGDQQSALFGQTCFDEGDVKCTFGTGSFVLMNTGSKKVSSSSGLLTTVAWRLHHQTTYALEGGAFVCGALVQWIRDGLNLISSSPEIETLAQKVKDSGGVIIVPSLTGLGAPYWASSTTGLITGLTRGTTSSHIARSALEAMAFQNVDLLMSMKKDLKKNLKAIRVDGGASANSLLLQIQSDLLGYKLQRPHNIETTSLGAGFMAGLGIGVWKSLNDIKKSWKLQKQFFSSHINFREKKEDERLA